MNPAQPPTAAPVLLAERHDQVVVITLNRPEKLNALDAALRHALRDTFDEFESDPRLRCAVLTGAGRAFCAGSDLREMTQPISPECLEEMQLTLGTRGRPTKPVIAAVNGASLGAGFLLQQDCDLVVAADTAVFGITESKVGRGSPWAVPLIHMIPQRVMLEMLLTGETIGAQRAYEIGLVNRVVPRLDVVETSVELARTIAANAPLSVRAAKQAVSIATEVGRTAALSHARDVYQRVYTSPDALEGPLAFAERREPTWTDT